MAVGERHACARGDRGLHRLLATVIDMVDDEFGSRRFALRYRSIMVPLSVKSCVLAGGVRSTVSGDKTVSGPISTDPDAYRQRDS